jgi:hypothetical protein
LEIRTSVNPSQVGFLQYPSTYNLADPRGIKSIGGCGYVRICGDKNIKTIIYKLTKRIPEF